jgi:serine/threonine protein phosphatase PrpC
MYTSAKYATHIGEDHNVNQDTAVILSKGRIHAYVVCDGHGDHGEKVSRYVASKIPVTALSYILDDGAFDQATTAMRAIKEALGDIDIDVKRNLKVSDSSGCTVAGVLFDSETGSGYMFSVGDSMVAAFYDDGKAQTCHGAQRKPTLGGLQTGRNT